MSRHRVTDDNQLVVTVTPNFFSRATPSAAGWPCLMIDYGGAALVLDVATIADLEHAEVFALGLTQSALTFASLCRYALRTATSSSSTPATRSSHAYDTLENSLVARSQIVINEGCPLSITRDQAGNVVVLCGGPSGESVEIVAQPSTLRALVELGANMLEQIDYPNQESINEPYQH
jgi:hypothetical protein